MSTGDEAPQPWSTVSGWTGNCRSRSRLIRCSNIDDLRTSIQMPGRWLPRGAGCSYGDAALLEEGRLVHLDDEAAGEIEQPSSGSITVSAAVTLRALLSELATRGLTLPVVPGVLDATIGGIVAADVHGKNHLTRGSIRDVTDSLKLMLPSGELVDCDRTAETDLFEATIGGMGLTGMITEVELQVIPLSARTVRVEQIATSDLESSLNQLRLLSQHHEHVAAWLDPTPRGAAFGRGIVVAGSPLLESQQPQMVQQGRWDLNPGSALPPLVGALVTPVGITCHNTLRHLRARFWRGTSTWKLDRLLFPLERWKNWKQIYNPKGFHQHQSLVPAPRCDVVIRQLLEMSVSGACPPTLVVLKMMRQGSGWLSFPDDGMTLSMDFRSEAGTVELLRQLDERVAQEEGRVYLAKDSTLTPELFRAMYPDLGKFQQIRQQFDPQRKLNSELSLRLKI
ncbi:MAG: FAD-binding oxidoreductase [Planctomycetota bacterium]|nr:FAD-binding oxidoreductase [Planctomycetota bacterium]